MSLSSLESIVLAIQKELASENAPIIKLANVQQLVGPYRPPTVSSKTPFTKAHKVVHDSDEDEEEEEEEEEAEAEEEELEQEEDEEAEHTESESEDEIERDKERDKNKELSADQKELNRLNKTIHHIRGKLEGLNLKIADPKSTDRLSDLKKYHAKYEQHLQADLLQVEALEKSMNLVKTPVVEQPKLTLMSPEQMKEFVESQYKVYKETHVKFVAERPTDGTIPETEAAFNRSMAWSNDYIEDKGQAKKMIELAHLTALLEKAEAAGEGEVDIVAQIDQRIFPLLASTYGANTQIGSLIGVSVDFPHLRLDYDDPRDLERAISMLNSWISKYPKHSMIKKWKDQLDQANDELIHYRRGMKGANKAEKMKSGIGDSVTQTGSMIGTRYQYNDIARQERYIAELNEKINKNPTHPEVKEWKLALKHANEDLAVIRNRVFAEIGDSVTQTGSSEAEIGAGFGGGFGLGLLGGGLLATGVALPLLYGSYGMAQRAPTEVIVVNGSGGQQQQPQLQKPIQSDFEIGCIMGHDKKSGRYKMRKHNGADIEVGYPDYQIMYNLGDGKHGGFASKEQHDAFQKHHPKGYNAVVASEKHRKHRGRKGKK